MATRPDGREIDFAGPHRGIVVRNDDPDGDHRIKASIPLQPETPWARPVTFGGGGSQRGGHIVPAVGDEVAVWFVGGDPSDLIYAPIGWRRIRGQKDAPTAMVAAGADAHQVQPIFQLGPMSLTVDERDGKRSIRLAALKKGREIVAVELDVEKGILSLTAAAGILLETSGTAAIKGSVLELKGRRVRSTGEPL